MPDTEIARNMFLFSTAAAAPAEAEVRPEVCLIERLLAGDQAAFDELYRMYAPVVHGIVLLRVPYTEAPDIVQEVFILAYENLGSLRDRNAFAGWLARIARNRAAEFHRTKRPAEELSDELRGPKNVSAEALEILETIRSLPETYRETLVLRLVEGMTGIEIADRTGLTHESVRVNLHRGMGLLRQKLGIVEKRK
jgi:RNA polymerase sigma-70 factor (ECF subfamily)